MYNPAIRKWSSPPSNENLLPRRGSNPGPAEPEADMLPSEPARRAHSQNVIHVFIILRRATHEVGIWLGLLYL